MTGREKDRRPRVPQTSDAKRAWLATWVVLASEVEIEQEWRRLHRGTHTLKPPDDPAASCSSTPSHPLER